MKLSNKIVLCISIPMLFALVISSVIELSILQSNTSKRVVDEIEKNLDNLNIAISQAPSFSPLDKELVLSNLVKDLATRPYVATAEIYDGDGNSIALSGSLPSPSSLALLPFFDAKPELNKNISHSTFDGLLVVTFDNGEILSVFPSIIIKNAIIFAVLNIIICFLVSKLMRVSQLPIDEVVKKLNDINSHNFTSPELILPSKEHEQLSTTVNTLASTLAFKFDELTRQAELFKKEASKDALTGLSNRGAFERHMRALLNENATSQEKELIVVRLAQLASINTKLGMVPGDNYVKAITNILMEETKNNSSIRFVFRLSGGDFALISEPMEKPTRDLVLTNISTQCASVTPLRDGTKATWIGVTRFTGSMTMQQVMESVDSALIASMKTKSGWQLASDIAHVHSNSQWRERLNHIVSQQYADIMIQPVMDIEKNMPAYYETSGRFKDKKTNDVIPMSQLIPASERLDLIPEVDKLVTNIVFKKMEVTSQQVAINLSITSIANREFREWLVKELTLRENLCSKLFFEIEDAALIQQREYTELLCRHLMGLGCRITIEHFGDNFASLSGLRVIQPQFVKLSGRLTQGIHTNKDNQLFVSSLISIAKNLNIKVIAEMVETEAESIALTKLGVEHQQGYYFAKPALWNVY